jgi:integrase
MTTGDYLDAFLNAGKARGLAPGTIVWYSIILHRLADAVPKMPRRAEPVEVFLAGVKVSPRTRIDYFKAMSAFFAWCAKRYGVTNPLAEMTPPKSCKTLPRTLSSTEIGCLFLAPMSARDRALVYLLLDTGIRIGEAVGLQVDDIGRDSLMVSGKTGPREVPVSSQVRSQLADIAGSRWVFEGRNGHLAPQWAYYLVRNAFAAVGIHGRKVGPHTLRHTFGRQWIMAGGDLVSLQRILGHSNIQTTRIYVDLNTADIIRQHHKFTPIRAALAPTQGRLIDEAETIVRAMRREES